MEAKAAPVTDAAPLTNPHFCTCCTWAQRPGQGWPARQQVASVTWQDSLHRGQQLLREDLEASGAPRAACDGAGGVGGERWARVRGLTTAVLPVPLQLLQVRGIPLGAQVEVGEDAGGLVLLGHEQQRLVVDEVSVLLQRPAQA